MKIHVVRSPSKNGVTLGELSIDGHFCCFTLEDEVRDGYKIPGKTAIPPGEYKVVIDYSNRFTRMMPHILDVPGFTGIRIHSGNTVEDTDGCILVGQTKGVTTVGNSRAAFAILFQELIEAAKRNEPITIEVENGA